MTRIIKTSTDNIVIFGAGGHAKVVVAALGALNIKPLSICDDAATKTPMNILGLPVTVFPQSHWWRETTPPPQAHIAIGNNRTRKELSHSIPANEWATIIHPTAIIHESAKIGKGVFVSARSIIHPDAQIGDHTIINTGAIIEHDCRVGDYCHIAPSVTLCGNTHVGDGTLIGVGSVTIPNVQIGAWASVGAASTIVRNVDDDTTVFGSPARKHNVK